MDHVIGFLGVWKIHVNFNEEQINNSPFTLSVYKPSLVRVYDLQAGTVGRKLTFTGEVHTLVVWCY